VLTVDMQLIQGIYFRTKSMVSVLRISLYEKRAWETFEISYRTVHLPEGRKWSRMITLHVIVGFTKIEETSTSNNWKVVTLFRSYFKLNFTWFCAKQPAVLRWLEAINKSILARFCFMQFSTLYTLVCPKPFSVDAAAWHLWIGVSIHPCWQRI